MGAPRSSGAAERMHRPFCFCCVAVGVALGIFDDGRVWPAGCRTLASLDTMARIRAHCHCTEAVWNAVDQALGGVATPTLFARLPASTRRQTLRTIRVGTDPNRRELHAMEMIHVAYMWRVSRQSLVMADIDPLADPAPVPAVAPGGPVVAGASPTKKVKVTDQMDDSEIDLMSRGELDQAHLWHIEVTGAEHSEPTSEQIAALRDRIVRWGESPYADFSILTPFGRTMQKQLKTRSWLLQQDGTLKALDIPGPPSFDAWKACWKVFRAILFMLR